MKFRVHLALLCVTLLFSANYIIAKIGLRHIDPLAFAYLRIVGAAILLLISAPLIGKWFAGPGIPPAKISWSDRGGLLVCALLGLVINQILFVAGLAQTTAHEAAILITSIPVFTLTGAIFIGTERLTTAKTIGLAVAGGGAILLLLQRHQGEVSGNVIGNSMILMNCLSYGLYLAYAKRWMQRFGPIRFLRITFVYAAIITTPITLRNTLALDYAGVPMTAWISLIAVVIGPTVVAYLLNAWALTHSESSLVAAYTYLQPLFASLLAIALLGERVGIKAVIAGALIVAGVALSSRGRTPGTAK